jgi:hypothetical protein
MSLTIEEIREVVFKHLRNDLFQNYTCRLYNQTFKICGIKNTRDCRDCLMKEFEAVNNDK